MTDSHFLNDLNDLDLNDRFSRFFGYLQCVFSCFAMFLQQTSDRKR